MLWLRLLSKQDQNRMQGWSIHIRSFGTTAVNKPTNKPTNKQVNGILRQRMNTVMLKIHCTTSVQQKTKDH